MRKAKSKRGFTLVELVVTVAILSITAGLGVGIFASTMNNYSTASVRSAEQDKATEIEDFIFTYARVCKNLYFIDSSKTDTLSSGTNYLSGVSQLQISPQSTQYMKMDPGSENLDYNTNDRDESGNIIASPVLTVQGVDNIVFTVSRQKLTRGDPDEDDVFYYLNYEINMVDGYSVTGSVILNNCENVNFLVGSSYVDTGDTGVFVVGDDSFTTGIGFECDPINTLSSTP